MLYIRLLAKTSLITAETYTENAETILNHSKNCAKTLPKCRNPHLPKLPKLPKPAETILSSY